MKRALVHRLSLLNFLRFGALSLSLPYINVYLTEQGFSGTAIGVLVSAGALMELILIPLLNAMADRRGKHRMLFNGLIFGSVVGNLMLAAITNRVVMSGSYLLTRFTARSTMSLLTQLTITRLDQLRRNIFGRVRMMGSVGWAVASLCAGLIYSVGSYPALFGVSALMAGAMLPLNRALPAQTTARHPSGLPPEPRQTGFYVLAASQFLFFAGLSAVGSFIWVFVEQDLGVPVAHIGLYASVFAIAEFLPMLLVDRLITRIGLRKVLIGGMLGMTGVWSAYGLLPAALWLVPLQMVRGAFFTMFTIGINLLVARTSAPANVATNQAIIQVTMPALAMLITSPVMGWIFDTFGARVMFQVAMMVGVVAVALLVVNYAHLEGRQKHADMVVQTGD